jgi:(2Fe-2S) ferredoxin
MIEALRPYRKLILVCTNAREDDSVCCARRGGSDLHAKIKEAVKAATSDVRVSRSGCLDNCHTGPTVVIMPDNKWFGEVTEADIPLIVEMVR